MQENDLHKLYKDNLEPQLAALEGKRRWIKFLYYLSFVVFGIMLWVISQGFMHTGGAIFLLIFVEAAIISFIEFFRLSYNSLFKNEVVAKIVELVNPAYVFDHKKYISLDVFNQSKLFSKRAAYAIGDDHIQGVIGNTPFAFSELRAWSRTKEIKKPGILSIIIRYLISLRKLQFFSHNRKNSGLIFKGLFFHADFNKHLTHSTFVLPDFAERLLGKSGQVLQRSDFHGQLVKLENIEFEKEFVVYSTSQQEARYVLTPVMMEAILNIKNKYHKKMYLSFTGCGVYFAIRFNGGLFEPRIHTSGVQYVDVEKMFDMLQLIEIIVAEMDLNTRIWTKE